MDRETFRRAAVLATYLSRAADVTERCLLVRAQAMGRAQLPGEKSRDPLESDARHTLAVLHRHDERWFLPTTSASSGRALLAVLAHVR
jgi:hypothetical protein